MKTLGAIVFLMCSTLASCCQGLEGIPPVLLDSAYHNTDSATSFIMTALDFHKFAKQGEQIYSSAVEIFDADLPWPPRWFTSGNIQVHDSMTGIEDMYIDARVQQNGDITFFNHEAVQYPSHKDIKVDGYITCNKKLEPIDTFDGVGLPLNYHEFRINAKGEKLVMAVLDTVLDMTSVSGDPGDSALKATVDLIEVFDAGNKMVFQWNPVKALGVGAFHWYYRWDRSFSAKPGYLDWSHGNAADFDFDGNIIYSFRHIGIGKISRNTGHVIWHFDRNKVPFIAGNDTIAFYMQHGLEKISDDPVSTTYVLYSNGDYVHHVRTEPDHPGAYGLEFSVNKKTHALHLVKKKKPRNEVLSISSGNYELEKNGDYLLNYGILAFRYEMDTSAYKACLEYGNAPGKIYGQYMMPFLINSFKVHRLHDWRPPRPSVAGQDNKLTAQGDMNDYTWYQLSGPGNTKVRMVGRGINFTPEGPGVFCVAGKYGLGWSVSLPFSYKL